MSPIKPSIDFTTFANIVAGKPRSSSRFAKGINPVNEEELWDVPLACEQDLDDAVEAARRAFPAWSAVQLDARKELINKYINLLGSLTDEFVTLLRKETGKPLAEASSEVSEMAHFLSFNRDLVIPEDRREDDQRIIITKYHPIGVVGAICPWNFPLFLAMGKVAPALATGNCIIVKPSPFTPYTVLKMCEVAQHIFPPGVVQVLGGDNMLGAWITAHKGIDKISFTGSIDTGKKVMAACSQTLKPVTLELGGNDACIILPDVDIEEIVPEISFGTFWNAGQLCVASKRIYIHEDIYDKFKDAFVKYVKNIKLDSGEHSELSLGPIQNRMQYEKVLDFVKDCEKNGYKVLTGRVPTEKGFFIEPTIIDNPPSDSLIITEEPFGPIVPLQPWSDEEEIIRRANDSHTGLGGSVWSKDVAHAQRIASRLETGSVFVNSFAKPAPEGFWSGRKNSGFGGEWGPQGYLAYCHPQVMHIYK